MPTDPVASITHHQLRVFAAVAGEGSFAKAARRLFMSEPTISTHIRSLERSIGSTLIDRSRGRRRVELTASGRMLLHTCQSVFQALEQGVAAIRSYEESARATIAIGSGPHFGGFVLPRLIEDFNCAHPNVTVRVEVGRNQNLLDELKRGRLDLAVLFAPIEDDEVVCEPFACAEVGLIGPAGHRYALEDFVSLERIVEEPLIVAEPSSPPRQALEQVAIGRGLSLRIVMEAQDIYARIKAVVNGLGVAPMYLDAAAPEIASGQLVLLNVEGFPKRLERLIVSPRNCASHDARDFRQYLLKCRDELARSA